MEKIFKTLAEALAIAVAGNGNEWYWFQFGGGAKRKYFVDTYGWVLIATDKPGAQGADIISADQIRGIPDIFRIQISSGDRSSVKLESSNLTVIHRLKDYRTLTCFAGEGAMWENRSLNASAMYLYITSDQQPGSLRESIINTGKAETSWVPSKGHNFSGKEMTLWVRAKNN